MVFQRNIARREQYVAAFADQTARVAQKIVLRHRFSRFQPSECVVRRRGFVHGTRGNVRAQRRPVERSGRAGAGTELNRARNRTIARIGHDNYLGVLVVNNEYRDVSD